MNNELKKYMLITKENSIHIWWFPKDFSQEQIGDIYTGSNACTAIILLVALRWHELADKTIGFEENSQFSDKIIEVLKDSIIRGNKIHKCFIADNKLKELNLSIPESIRAIGSEIKFLTEWQTSVHVMDLGDTLHNNLINGIKDWENIRPLYNPDLFAILIAENLCILFVFPEEHNQVLLIDTHAHNDKGAVVACVLVSELKSLCHWYYSLTRQCYNVLPKVYELSFFFFKRHANQ